MPGCKADQAVDKELKNEKRTKERVTILLASTSCLNHGLNYDAFDQTACAAFDQTACAGPPRTICIFHDQSSPTSHLYLTHTSPSHLFSEIRLVVLGFLNELTSRLLANATLPSNHPWDNTRGLYNKTPVVQTDSFVFFSHPQHSVQQTPHSITAFVSTLLTTFKTLHNLLRALCQAPFVNTSHYHLNMLSPDMFPLAVLVALLVVWSVIITLCCSEDAAIPETPMDEENLKQVLHIIPEALNIGNSSDDSHKSLADDVVLDPIDISTSSSLATNVAKANSYDICPFFVCFKALILVSAGTTLYELFIFALARLEWTDQLAIDAVSEGMLLALVLGFVVSTCMPSPPSWSIMSSDGSDVSDQAESSTNGPSDGNNSDGEPQEYGLYAVFTGFRVLLLALAVYIFSDLLIFSFDRWSLNDEAAAMAGLKGMKLAFTLALAAFCLTSPPAWSFYLKDTSEYMNLDAAATPSVDAATTTAFIAEDVLPANQPDVTESAQAPASTASPLEEVGNISPCANFAVGPASTARRVASTAQQGIIKTTYNGCPASSRSFITDRRQSGLMSPSLSATRRRTNIYTCAMARDKCARDLEERLNIAAGIPRLVYRRTNTPSLTLSFPSPPVVAPLGYDDHSVSEVEAIMSSAPIEETGVAVDKTALVQFRQNIGLSEDVSGPSNNKAVDNILEFHAVESESTVIRAMIPAPVLKAEYSGFTNTSYISSTDFQGEPMEVDEYEPEFDSSNAGDSPAQSERRTRLALPADHFVQTATKQTVKTREIEPAHNNGQHASHLAIPVLVAALPESLKRLTIEDKDENSMDIDEIVPTTPELDVIMSDALSQEDSAMSNAAVPTESEASDASTTEDSGMSDAPALEEWSKTDMIPASAAYGDVMMEDAVAEITAQVPDESITTRLALLWTAENQTIQTKSTKRTFDQTLESESSEPRDSRKRRRCEAVGPLERSVEPPKAPATVADEAPTGAQRHEGDEDQPAPLPATDTVAQQSSSSEQESEPPAEEPVSAPAPAASPEPPSTAPVRRQRQNLPRYRDPTVLRRVHRTHSPPEDDAAEPHSQEGQAAARSRPRMADLLARMSAIRSRGTAASGQPEPATSRAAPPSD
nr:hypothetical protein CFP56_56053 [Quercus suber]